MNLEVNLDGQGPAERTGTLWARDFRVLGDPIISEVLQNADGTQTEQRRAGRASSSSSRSCASRSRSATASSSMHNARHQRPVGERLHAGQGRLQGADARHGRHLCAGVTGLMRALASIPLLGPMLTGPRGEGVFGITFAIQGSMAKPQVIVNPLSLITPGIFREIFNMTPEDPRVQPRDRPRPKATGPRARARRRQRPRVEQLARRVHDATQIASRPIAVPRANLFPKVNSAKPTIVIRALRRGSA